MSRLLRFALSLESNLFEGRCQLSGPIVRIEGTVEGLVSLGERCGWSAGGVGFWWATTQNPSNQDQ